MSKMNTCNLPSCLVVVEKKVEVVIDDNLVVNNSSKPIAQLEALFMRVRVNDARSNWKVVN